VRADSRSSCGISPTNRQPKPATVSSSKRNCASPEPKETSRPPPASGAVTAFPLPPPPVSAHAVVLPPRASNKASATCSCFWSSAIRPRCSAISRSRSPILQGSEPPRISIVTSRSCSSNSAILPRCSAMNRSCSPSLPCCSSSLLRRASNSLRCANTCARSAPTCACVSARAHAARGWRSAASAAVHAEAGERAGAQFRGGGDWAAGEWVTAGGWSAGG
jgi:hypothetical protein